LDTETLLKDAASDLFIAAPNDVAKFLYEDMKDSTEGLMKAFDTLNDTLFTPDQMEGLADRFADFVTNDLFGEGAGVKDVEIFIKDNGDVCYDDKSDSVMREMFGDDFSDALLDFVSDENLSADVISNDFITVGENDSYTVDINADNINDIVKAMLDTGIERPNLDTDTNKNSDVINDVKNDIDKPAGMESDADIEAFFCTCYKFLNNTPFFLSHLPCPPFVYSGCRSRIELHSPPIFSQ
jgi:hypothetical protein